LGIAPPLTVATDDNFYFETLKDRFGTYYDNVRKVTNELVSCCEQYKPSPKAGPGPTIIEKISNLLFGYARI
jgi:hypothetical protein